MAYEITFRSNTRKTLRKIPPDDRERILEQIILLQENPRPRGATKLTNEDSYRIRQGDYRIIYTIKDSVLIVEVIRIGHRKDIYRK